MDDEANALSTATNELQSTVGAHDLQQSKKGSKMRCRSVVELHLKASLQMIPYT